MNGLILHNPSALDVYLIPCNLFIYSNIKIGVKSYFYIQKHFYGVGRAFGRRDQRMLWTTESCLNALWKVFPTINVFYVLENKNAK